MAEYRHCLKRYAVCLGAHAGLMNGSHFKESGEGGSSTTMAGVCCHHAAESSRCEHWMFSVNCWALPEVLWLECSPCSVFASMRLNIAERRQTPICRLLLRDMISHVAEAHVIRIELGGNCWAQSRCWQPGHSRDPCVARCIRIAMH